MGAVGEISYQKYLDIIKILSRIEDQELCYEFANEDFCMSDEIENITRILSTIEFKVKLKRKE